MRKTKELHLVVSNLIKIRNDKRLNQYQFSEILGIDYSIYNKIESGYISLSLEKISNFAIKLKMREIDLFTYPDIYEKHVPEEEKTKILLEFEISKKEVVDLCLKNKIIRN